jgi:flavin-dependent dehydrogenase
VIHFDVVVIGGGPAGSVCAARLAQRGRRVLVLEKGTHPRFHLGESLLPRSLAVLEAIGVLDRVRERFLVKRGASFVAPDGRRTRYSFADAFRCVHDHAFQVPRDEFDELLFRHAAASGADTREEWEVTRVVLDGTRAAGVEARAPDGSVHAFDAAFVVDASGRDALLARARGGGEEKIATLDKTALYVQVRGAWRDEGEREGDLQIVVFDSGWFWLIPLADGRSSTGAVVSSAWVREHRARPEAMLDAAISESPPMRHMLSGTERVFTPGATADFSFRVRDLAGDAWVALGDAGGFIDPLFSTGAHLAMHGALTAADLVDEALAAGDTSRARFAAWEREMKGGAELFVGAVQSFYDGPLRELVFVPDPHPFLRRAITSILAGDVFDPDARWVREMRARFPARAD